MFFENVGTIYKSIKKYGKKSVFLKTFSVISILTFLVIICGIVVFFYYSSEAYDKQNMQIVSSKLYSSRNRFDSITTQINSLNSDIQTKNDLQNLAENNREELAELLKSQNQTLNILHSVYLYIPDEDYVISTSKVYESGELEDFQDKSWVSPYKKGEVFFYREFPDIGMIKKCFSYVKPIGEKYIIIYNVDYSKMNLSDNSYESNRLYMISALDSLIYTSDDEPLDKTKLREYLDVFEDIGENNRAYVHSHQTIDEIILLVSSAKNSVRFMTVLPRRWKSSIAVWKIFLLLVVSLLTSVLLSSFIVTKVYKPFSKIIAFEKDFEKTETDSNNEVNSILDYVMDIVMRNEHIEKELLQNALLLQNAQVSALQLQLNPHFLFNTLQLLNGMILAEAKTDTPTMQVISLLSVLLREAVDVSEFFRPFSKEVEISEIYLEIQRIRYPERFDVIWNIDDRVGNLKVPKSILQPLFENAISYGINRIREKGIIEIKAFLQENDFYISVNDNGPGFKPERIYEINEILSGKRQVTNKNIGLYNVNQRIKTLFGKQYGLGILSGSGGKIIIRLPAEPYQRANLHDIEED